MSLINSKELDILRHALSTLEEGFAALPDFSTGADLAPVETVLEEVAVMMRDNYPYHHPMYAGQMLKPPHPMARLAYMLAMWINPNNHALDGGVASSQMEKEAVADLCRMFGFDDALGHLCGGGTIANLEALWVAGKLNPGSRIAGSMQAHYTHQRISEVLGIDYVGIASDNHGRMDLQALRQELANGDIGTVVATMATTGLGAVDPLSDILDLSGEFGFRVHADAAYGGYFHIATRLSDAARAHFDRLPDVDSIVIDPHKHGLQPYGCGCVLFRDPSVGQFYRHDSPYTYFSSDNLHLGEITLECSRAGASAVALWATQKLLPMQSGGEFSRSLDRSLDAASAMYARLQASKAMRPLMEPETDIVVYAVERPDAVSVSKAAKKLFEDAAERDLHLALIKLPSDLVRHHWPELHINQDTVTCLRSCLLKPEQLDWVDRICDLLEELVS